SYFNPRGVPDLHSQRQRGHRAQLVSLDSSWSWATYLPLEQVNQEQHWLPFWISHFLNTGPLPGLLFSSALLYPTSACRRPIRRRSNQQHFKPITPPDRCGSILSPPFICIVRRLCCLCPARPLFSP